jgi:hypothetical protein
MESNTGNLLNLTVSPKLDAALQGGWQAWEETARSEGPDKVANWLSRRLRNPALKADLIESIETALASDEAEDRALAWAEIAEIAEGHDDLLADTLWEGVLSAGLDADDAELIFDATSHLAAIAEDHADPLAAAEYYLDFLNWRRREEHSSEIDAVETAFEEVIRLARFDGEQRAAALFEYRQAQFTRLADTDDDRATTGDWERDPAPYLSWA